ncbi:MAG: benzoyl-CoA-dihydrodiol lyase [Betaproteobacteria bacterium]|nr:MAG: benzoyl-CoA-dihydrodiol lyase [Betaproteobacteria bacterium]
MSVTTSINDTAAPNSASEARPYVNYETHPDRYAHWHMSVDGAVATLSMDVNEEKGLQPGYKLKLNSYDLGVDIELNDALNRIRFEHPQVKCVVFTSSKERMFCSGANIYMLGLSSHAWKVNFCRFTNETRNGIEDSSRNDGLRFLAAVNGTVAGGGYELALACDEILMIDDRSSTVSLPEVPLLGVLPGTGGLTRVIDKRQVRRDLADVFCSTAEGVRANRALDWKLVDHTAKPQQFEDAIKQRVAELVGESTRPDEANGIELKPLDRTIDGQGLHYRRVDVLIDRNARIATITVLGPEGEQPTDPDSIHSAGADWWPLAMARELDDAILMLRTNEPQIGIWIFKTRGDLDAVLKTDAILMRRRSDWLVKETIGLLRRTLARLDVSSRSMFALIEPGSCFGGTLLELALAADRSYMLATPDDQSASPVIATSMINFGAFPMVNHLTRLQTRFCGDGGPIEKVFNQLGEPFRADEAARLGLVTFTPDEFDWDDEVRIAIEERASLSPDALTGMEANLRFTGNETMETRIFGRLSAWQNWIFNRPNAVGEQGALKVFGSGSKPNFNWERI